MNHFKILWGVVSVLLSIQVQAQPEVLPAMVDVSAIGTATYVIPVEVVPGTMGLQPNLSIGYNSMSGLGVLGTKWNLSGVSSITRSCQTSFFDGNISPVRFDTSDRFTMDGQRMILFDGPSYQCKNAVYCFEIEDFSRITKLGTGNDFYFKQTLADGSIVEFGKTSQSRLDVGDGKHLSWMVDKVTDPCGNYMKYYYQQSDGEIWIDHIDYTLLSNETSAYACVAFDYEDMTSPNDGFVGGHQVRQSKRLKNIIVKYQGTQVRRYSFFYNSEHQYDRLETVVLYDAADTLLSSTSITWSTPSSTMATDETITLLPGGYYTAAGNFNADRIYDIYALKEITRTNPDGNVQVLRYDPYIVTKNRIGTGFSYSYVGYQFPTRRFDNLSAVDIDGDGLDEIVYRDGNTSTYYSLKVTASSIPTPISILYTNATHLTWGDFDGDGVLEPVAYSGGDNYFNFRYMEGTAETAFPLDQTYDYCYAGDFDGDGKMDLMFLNNSYSHIYSYNTRTHVWEHVETDGFPNAYQKLVVGDFNGDGMSDVLFLPVNETQWKLAMRIGKNKWTFPVQVITELDGSHISDGIVEPKYLPIACDINGDGKCDIIQPVDDYTVRYIVSKGCRDGRLQYTGSGTFPLSNGQLFRKDFFSMGDYDGNGIVDFLFSNPSQGGLPATIKYLYRDSFPGFFVKQISDAAAKTIQFEYSTISLMPDRFYGNGMSWMALPLVKNMAMSDGIGGMDTTAFYYGNAQYDSERHQFIGFSLFGKKRDNTLSETFMSRVRKGSNGNHDTFAMLVPDSVVNYITPDVVVLGDVPYWNSGSHIFLPSGNNPVSMIVNTYGTLYRTNVAGNVSFLPYTAVSSSYDYSKNTKVVKEITMNSSNWLPAHEYTGCGYISGSNERPSRQIVDFSYIHMALPNGTSVQKPTVQITRNYNNTTYSYPRRDTVTFSYTAKGLLALKQHSDNGGLSVTEKFLYNENGTLKKTSVTPKGGGTRSVTMEYDPTYRFVIRTTDHAGNVTQKTFDPASGTCLSETGIDGLSTLYEYDPWGRLTQTSFPDGTYKKIQYTNTSGGLSDVHCYTTVTASGKPETRIYFDHLGRKTHTYVSGQGYMDIVYNKIGQVTKQTQVPYASASALASSKKWKTFRYDALGRLTKDSSNYQEYSYSYQVDSSNHLYKEEVINKMGAVSTKYCDPSGRVVKVVDNGGEVTYTYDRMPQGALVHDRMLITTGGKTTTIVTDSRGNRLSLADPDAGTTISTYDPWGCISSQTDGKGDVTSTIYDTQNRLVFKTYSLGGGTDTFTYKYGEAGVEKGRIVKVSHNGSTYQEFSYDAAGRLSSETKYIEGTGHTHHYTYNNEGQIHTITFPSGFVLYHFYDSDGRLSCLNKHDNYVDIYTVDYRNVLSQPLRCWFGNSTGVIYKYDDWGLPTKIQYGHREFHWPDNPLVRADSAEIRCAEIKETVESADLDELLPDPNVGIPHHVGNQYSVLLYSYNDNGYITQKKENKTGQQEDFSYDTLGRLTSVSVNNTLFYNYTYDNNGNIKRNSRLGNTNYEYAADKPHAVVGAVDEHGTLPSTQCDVTYNSRNRPATISENGWSIALSYGSGLQRETSTLKNGDSIVQTTYFISKDCELEITPSGSRYIDYIYAEGKLVALHVHNNNTNADSLYYVQTDLLGSWDRIVDDNRTVVQSSHFDPWGNRMSASDWTLAQDGSNFAFRRGFTGHEHYDRFGIINMNARLYDPVLGRFFSPDPQVQDPFSTQGFNRYSYCGNNPVMCVDEDGESVLAIVLSVLAGAYLGGTYANHTTNPTDWSWSSGTTWEYVLGGALLGGASCYVGAAVAASGVPMANTLGLAYSSFYYSCGMSALTEGQIPVTMSLGGLGYNFDGHSWGYPFKEGNGLLQNTGYCFGVLANLPDLVSLVFGKGQTIDVNTDKFIGFDETGNKVDWWSHESITHNGETIISVGPLEDQVNKDASLWNQLRDFKANKEYTHGYGAPGTWTISIDNVSRNVLDWYNSNVSTWNILFKSCVGHSTWALLVAGVPTIYLCHPAMLGFQLLTRQMGIALSPYLQTHINQ